MAAEVHYDTQRRHRESRKNDSTKMQTRYFLFSTEDKEYVLPKRYGFSSADANSDIWQNTILDTQLFKCYSPNCGCLWSSHLQLKFLLATRGKKRKKEKKKKRPRVTQSQFRAVCTVSVHRVALAVWSNECNSKCHKKCSKGTCESLKQRGYLSWAHRFTASGCAND